MESILNRDISKLFKRVSPSLSATASVVNARSQSSLSTGLTDCVTWESSKRNMKYGTTLLRAMLRNMKTWWRKRICWYGIRLGNIVWRIEEEDGRSLLGDKAGELGLKKIEARNDRVEGEEVTGNWGAGKTDSSRESSPAKMEAKRT